MLVGIGNIADSLRLGVRKQNSKKMKRIGYLYEKIISMDNLRLADEKARKGKRNTYGVRVFDKNREDNLLKLYEMLKIRRSEHRCMTFSPSMNRRRE